MLDRPMRTRDEGCGTHASTPIRRSVGVVPAALGGDLFVAREQGRREHPLYIEGRVAGLDTERRERPVQVGDGIEGLGIVGLVSLVVHVARDGDRTGIIRVVPDDLIPRVEFALSTNAPTLDTSNITSNLWNKSAL
jgi:hypothetical protein